MGCLCRKLYTATINWYFVTSHTVPCFSNGNILLIDNDFLPHLTFYMIENRYICINLSICSCGLLHRKVFWVQPQTHRHSSAAEVDMNTLTFVSLSIRTKTIIILWWELSNFCMQSVKNEKLTREYWASVQKGPAPSKTKCTKCNRIGVEEYKITLPLIDLLSTKLMSCWLHTVGT